MKIIVFCSLVISFLYVQIIGQQGPSIHQVERNLFKENKLNKVPPQSSGQIIPLNKNMVKKLNKAVFGYYPDWEYQNNAHNYFNYDLLSHIAAFDFSVSSTGQISEPWGWPWTNVINEAHQNGVKVIMVIVNFNADDIHNLLTNSFNRWGFMLGVQNKIKEFSLDGVNIDFEGLDVADRGDLINGFMQELSDSVHSIDPELEVSFAAPAVDWGGWKLTGLAEACDYLFIMGYAFYGSWSSTTGPTAPLISTSLHNITNTINVEYGTVTSFYPEKIILGVPYYGPHWTALSSDEGSATIDYINAVRFRQSGGESSSHGRNWSNTFKNSWYHYVESSVHHQVWFDDAASLGLKYDLAISENLKGIGMWALGYDGSRDELWNLIEEKFTTIVNVEKEIISPINYTLSQNYPNPFNPTTTISYSIKPNKSNSSQYVELKIYNLLGSEIKTLVNIFQPTGNYNVEFNASELPSGVYYYNLRVDAFFETKKMILIK